MLKIINTVIKAVPVLIGLFKGNTPEQGKGIVKSGVASLTIASLISAGKLSASGLDSTLLLILSILETIGYLYGMVAISSGASQTSAFDELLKGKGEGLSHQQARILGHEWLKQIQKNKKYKLPGNSLFDDDYPDLKIEAKDISQFTTNNTKEDDQ